MTDDAPAFVLVHSPSVGPRTWTPVAQRLTDRGATSMVPSLLSVADAPIPSWPYVTKAANDSMRSLQPDRPVILVAHSNAGLFIPLLVTQAARPVLCCIFVDAALPELSSTSTPMAPPALVDFLRGKVVGGRLPPWIEWWDDADIAPMFPDPASRERISEEQPLLTLDYYQQAVTIPEGWDRLPMGYLLFGPPYDTVAADARRRGWLVRELPGLHLHQIVDPDGTADALEAMARHLTSKPGRNVYST